MSIGNVKTTGSKGTNWPWQYAMIKTLNSISSSLGASTEFESRLVRLIASPYTLYLEVRLWDVDSNDWSGTPKYYEVGSNTPVALNPADVQYADEDNALVLDAIKTACETTATETTSIDTNTAGILADTAVIETNTTGILADTAAIDSAVNGSRTAGMSRESGSSDVAALSGATNVYSASFYNAHASVVATVVGASLNPGETVNFDAGGNGCFLTASALTYNGNSGDLVVAYIK